MEKRDSCGIVTNTNSWIKAWIISDVINHCRASILHKLFPHIIASPAKVHQSTEQTSTYSSQFNCIQKFSLPFTLSLKKCHCQVFAQAISKSRWRQNQDNRRTTFGAKKNNWLFGLTNTQLNAQFLGGLVLISLKSYNRFLISSFVSFYEVLRIVNWSMERCAWLGRRARALVFVIRRTRQSQSWPPRPFQVRRSSRFDDDKVTRSSKPLIVWRLYSEFERKNLRRT